MTATSVALAGPPLLVRMAGDPGRSASSNSVAAAADAGRSGTDRRVSLSIDAPRTARAGTVIDVVVRGARSGESLTLVALGSQGSVARRRMPVDGTAVFQLGSDATRLAGTTTLIARQGGSIRSATVQLTPGPVEATLDPIIGPRSMIADGRDAVMEVAFPMDALGNVAADGTEVEMLLTHPDGSVSDATTRVSGLLAWHVFTSKTTAGTALGIARSAGRSGRAYALRETTGLPVAYALIGPERVPAADGFSIVTVSTTPLQDVFGNVLVDGTAVAFTWDSAAGRSRQVSTTIGGVAELHLEAPQRPGSIRFQAWAVGTTSAPLTLTFPPAAIRLPLTASVAGAELRAVVGPVVGSDGALLRDGTSVDLTVTDANGRTELRQAELVHAGALFDIAVSRLQAPLRVTASVLGIDAAVDAASASGASSVSGASPASGASSPTASTEVRADPTVPSS